MMSAVEVTVKAAEFKYRTLGTYIDTRGTKVAYMGVLTDQYKLSQHQSVTLLLGFHLSLQNVCSVNVW